MSKKEFSFKIDQKLVNISEIFDVSVIERLFYKRLGHAFCPLWTGVRSRQIFLDWPSMTKIKLKHILFLLIIVPTNRCRFVKLNRHHFIANIDF